MNMYITSVPNSVCKAKTLKTNSFYCTIVCIDATEYPIILVCIESTGQELSIDV